MHRPFLLALCLWLGAGLAHAGDPPATLVQLLDYLGVDYAGAVDRGEVTNPAEYAEMQEFAGSIAANAAQLPEGPAAEKLRSDAAALAALIERRADPAEVRAHAQAMRNAILQAYPLRAVPTAAPDLARGRALFTENCSSCHGASGHGDGLAAAGLTPPPTDFHDAQRARQRSLYGLFVTISHGVEGTAMPSFAQLPEADRWALAFVVGGFANAAPSTDGALPAWAERSTLVTSTPAEVEAAHGSDGAQAMARFRAQPALLFDEDPVARTRRLLARAQDAYHAGDAAAAYTLALAAYLEGFELVEPALKAVDPALRTRGEEVLLAHRSAINDRAPPAEVDARYASALAVLDTCAQRLGERSLSGASAFSASFIILLREGLEALLVIAALMAFLVKTGQRRGLPYLHAGWLAAIALGGVLWWASARYVHVGGEARELAEGIGALFAAGVMFYLGFWMHNRSHAQEWQRYIRDNMNRILSRGSLWGLAGLSFIAVFRECFEVVLFYQALWAQTDAAGRAMTFTGIGAAALALLVLGALILRFSTRLPLRQFFAATGVFLFVLALVFAGKGVVALQEAGKLPLMPVPGPTVELIGLYPNAVSLSLQVAMVLIAVLLLRRSSPSP